MSPRTRKIDEFRKLWVGLLEDGIADGVFRADLDVELAYRFVRDTVWVAAHWYRPGGALSPDQISDQYLGILLDGISTRTSPVPGGSPRGSRSTCPASPWTGSAGPASRPARADEDRVAPGRDRQV